MNKKILGWISYDFANSAFTTVIVTVVYSVYFKSIVVGKEGVGDSLWGLSVSVSMLIVALMSPVLGAIADHTHSKKKFLFTFCYTSVLFTALLYFVKPGAIFWGMIVFIIANIGYEGGNVFYNAFLPEITHKDNIGKISGLGWGIGYLGGLSALVLSYLFIETNVPMVFPLTAAFFGFFAIPTFILLKEKKVTNAKTNLNYFSVGYSRIKNTLRHIKDLRELWRFLISFFIYNDGIRTIIVFGAIYGAQRFDMTGSQLILYFVLANITSFIGAIIFGFVVDRIGAKRTISLTLIIWIATVIWAFFCNSISQFYGVGLLAGIAIGSCQSASRSLFSMLTPENKHAEFFGFYAVSGKAAAILGPLIYGLLVLLLNSQRWAILSIALFFVVGFILLQQVDEKKGIQVAATMFRKE